MMLANTAVKAFPILRPYIEGALSIGFTELTPLFAGLAVVQVFLSFRSQHHVGVSVGMMTVSLLLAIHSGMYQAQLQALPKPVVFALVGWMLLLLYIRVRTWSPNKAYSRGFPVQVYRPLGCTRVATDFKHRAKGESVPIFDAPISDVRTTVMKWLKLQGASVIVDRPDYIYARCLTKFMGFPDEVAIRLKSHKDKKTQTVVEIQCELVMGTSDLSVNLNRVKSFISYLNFMRK